MAHHSTFTTSNTGDKSKLTPLGDFVGATDSLHSVDIHDVDEIERVTETIRKEDGTSFEVTKLRIISGDDVITINCFRA